jgi:hypothetical protein
MEATWLPKRYGSDMAETETETETGSMLNQVIIALEDSVDSFTQHVAEDIFKRQSLAAKLEHLAKADYEPLHHKCMLLNDNHKERNKVRGRSWRQWRKTAYGKGIISHP